MPPESTLQRRLDAIVRRMWIAAYARGAAVGLTAGAAIGVALAWQGRTPRGMAMAAVAAAAAALMVWRGRGAHTRRAAALRLEQQHPSFRNVIVTAEELIAHPGRASGWMRERVLADAELRVAGVEAAPMVRITRPLVLFTAALAVWMVVLASPPGRMADAVRRATTQAMGAAVPTAAAGGLRVVFDVEPPVYTGLPAREEENPERLEVIEGTRVRISLDLDADGPPMRVRLGTRTLDATVVGGALVAEAELRESGYVAIEPRDGDGSRRLVPVLVTPDRAPAVRVEAPGRDLLLPRAPGSVPITVVAHDDFGLELLEIRYTTVSGSGEQFAFEEGTLPARVTRGGAREWRAEASLPVDALKLGPGDAVVYRAVARDARPGERGLGASDTFFVEIQGRGYVLLDGLEMPPEQERYALSQQMVVMKIERLRARERSMTAGAVREEAARIAAEQRSVRANFIFLMGGHVEDEVEEAEHAHEIQEGRLENSARKEISTAIHHMTGAAEGLTAASTGKALPPARAAVEALQRAFGRNRYILRSLAVQSRIDPSRRLSGSLDAASDWRRDPGSPAEDPVSRDARAVLAGLLAAVSASESGGEIGSGRLAALAEQALRVAPDSADWQQIAAAILAAGEASESKQPRETIRARLQAAIEPVARAAEQHARPPAPAGGGASTALERAWAREARR